MRKIRLDKEGDYYVVSEIGTEPGAETNKRGGYTTIDEAAALALERAEDLNGGLPELGPGVPSDALVLGHAYRQATAALGPK